MTWGLDVVDVVTGRDEGVRAAKVQTTYVRYIAMLNTLKVKGASERS